MKYFPMMINMKGKNALVVGGGKAALRKAALLLEFGAEVTVVAPETAEGFGALEESGRAEILRQSFEESDIADLDPFLVVAATDSSELNRSIGELCDRRNIPVNVTDSQERSSFVFPAMVQEEDVLCAVSSGGQSPAVAQYLQEQIRAMLPQGIGEINRKLGELRESFRKEFADPEERRRKYREKLLELLAEKSGAEASEGA